MGNMEGAVNLTKLLRQIQSIGYLAYPSNYSKWPDKLGPELVPLPEACYTLPG